MSGEWYEPPPINVVHFIGRAGVVIEVAPNQFFQYILEIRHGDPGDRCEIAVERDGDLLVTGADLLEPSRYQTTTGWRADLHLTGRIISREEADRPSWAPAAEIEARREIGS